MGLHLAIGAKGQDVRERTLGQELTQTVASQRAQMPT